MASYSVATTRDNLSSLIDKAMAGEEVVITRHGKPTVSLHVVENVAAEAIPVAAPDIDWEKRQYWAERLRLLRESLPPSRLSEMEYKRIEQDEWESRFDR
jgi:prevent-host-death family protein